MTKKKKELSRKLEAEMQMMRDYLMLTKKPKKEEYYRSLVGKWFEVEMKQ